MNMSVRDISLDYLVDQKLNVNSKPLNDIGNDIKATRAEIETIKQTRRSMIEELTGTHNNAARKMALENEVRQLNSKRQALITKLDRIKDQQKSDSRTLDTLRRNTRREILTEADIVCSTLSGAGHELLSDIEFEMVIIDEAAQSIELSSLIPLKYGCSRCVMVGDPQQLPPTVLSQEVSLFVSTIRPALRTNLFRLPVLLTINLSSFDCKRAGKTLFICSGMPYKHFTFPN